MIDALQKFEQIFSAFTVPGARDWNVTAGGLTYWGKAAGLTADDIIARAHAAGITNRDGSIRSGWNTAKPRFIDGKPTEHYTPRARKATQPPQHARHVRNLIGGMGDCDLDAVRELSPCLDWIGQPERTQTALFMRAAFAPGELLHVFRDDVPTVGAPGVNIRPAADWVQAVERGEPLPGDLIVPNPFTGEQGTTTAGKKSFIAQSCLAAFPFMVLEMDDAAYAFGGDAAKGLALQFAFWRRFILTSRLAPALVALTYSGGKSIHGLLRVGGGSLAEWEHARDVIRGLFASDAECVIDSDGKQRFPYRIDNQALMVRQGTRLPGVRRFGNHALQELVYLNPNARAGTMWREPVAPPPPIDPNGKPPCGAAFGKGMCGVCVRLADCPFADPDAVTVTILKGGAKCRKCQRL